LSRKSLETFPSAEVFKTGAINHSATSPTLTVYLNCFLQIPD
jgi:hypothetical protein